MAKTSKARPRRNPKNVQSKEVPQSLAIAERGVFTGQQFSALMSALMTDLLKGTVTPGIGNATCNAGGKLIKMVELNLKYGKQRADGGIKNLTLVTDEEEDEPEEPKNKK
jgi:hypothetical protein